MDTTELDALWQSYTKNRDPQVREKLLMQYLPLVKYIAGRMMTSLPSSVDYNDLVSAGVVGLIGALERFHPSRGVKFETYVLPRIKGAILDELRTLDWAPRSLRSKARRLDRATQELEKSLGRTASREEIAKKLHLNLDDFESLAREASTTLLLSLDRIHRDEQEQAGTMYDVVENPFADNPLKQIEKSEAKAALLEALDALPEQEKLVLALYYYEDLTLREIGEVLNLTESRVSQIHSKAIAALKETLKRERVFA